MPAPGRLRPASLGTLRPTVAKCSAISYFSAAPFIVPMQIYVEINRLHYVEQILT
jgi:hypothetical protein